MNRRKKLGVIAAAAGILLLTPVTVLAEDKWESKNGGRYRVKEDGTYYAGEDGKMYVNGWFVIEGTYSNGKLYSNWYYQQEDGSIIIPEVLRPYMGGIERITK